MWNKEKTIWDGDEFAFGRYTSCWRESWGDTQTSKQLTPSTSSQQARGHKDKYKKKTFSGSLFSILFLIFSSG
jgi:hypothetical protein